MLFCDFDEFQNNWKSWKRLYLGSWIDWIFNFFFHLKLAKRMLLNTAKRLKVKHPLTQIPRFLNKWNKKENYVISFGQVCKLCLYPKTRNNLTRNAFCFIFSITLQRMLYSDQIRTINNNTCKKFHESFMRIFFILSIRRTRFLYKSNAINSGFLKTKMLPLTKRS